MTEEEITAMVAANKELTSNNESLALSVTKLESKTSELLGEKKKIGEAKLAADELATKSAAEALQKAGDFKSLYESSQAENEKVRIDAKSTMEKYDMLNGQIAIEKVNSEALKISTDLADGHNVALLSNFIRNRLKHTDEGIKVTDASGNLTVSSIDDLKKEFKGNEVYASLLKGNQSSGGGATGTKESGSATDADIDRNEIMSKSPKNIAAHFAKQRAKT